MFKNWEIDKVYEWFEKSKTILNDETINNIQNIINEYEKALLNLDNIRFNAWK